MTKKYRTRSSAMRMNGDLGACFGRKKPNIDSLKYGKFAQKAKSAMTIQLAEAEFTQYPRSGRERLRHGVDASRHQRPRQHPKQQYRDTIEREYKPQATGRLNRFRVCRVVEVH